MFSSAKKATAFAISSGAPIFEQAGVPAIGVTCTNPQVTDSPNYWRICFTDPFQGGTVLASLAYNTLGATTVYALAEQGNDYDLGLVNYFTEAFSALPDRT